MRNSILFLIVFSLLTACGAPSGATPMTSARPTGNSAMPTRFSLGSCTDVRQPTPDPNEVSLFAPVTEKEHILGRSDAYVTILVYSDFQCSSCAKLAALLNSFVAKYPQDVRVVFRHFPLESIHDKAALAAQAAEAAALQGKFWQMHDFLFSSQGEWLDKKPAEFQPWIIKQTASLGLDPARLQADMVSPAVTKTIQNAWDEGQRIKLPGAPMILINGEIIKWQVSLFDQLESLVLLAKLPKQQFNKCPPLVIDPAKQYTARLKTTRGEVLIKLRPDKAPNAVNNFVFLAQNGWFDNIPFYRVIPGVIAQTGDPTGTGLGNPGYFISSEKNTSLLYDRAGILGFSNSGPDSNGSQFFITLSAAPQFNKDFPIFGEVISGLDVLSQLSPRDPATSSAPPQADMLISVSIEAK